MFGRRSAGESATLLNQKEIFFLPLRLAGEQLDNKTRQTQLCCNVFLKSIDRKRDAIEPDAQCITCFVTAT